MIDLACSLGTLAVFALAGARKRRAGAAPSPRVGEASDAARLSRGAMAAGDARPTPVGRALAALGATANGITLVSLVLGLLAGVALSLGHFGVGAALAATATLGDARGGIVARPTGASSDGGDVLGAAAHRYREFFLLGGLAVHFRADPTALALTLAALLGSFMVSYGTAKAGALGVEPPRGAMRRLERAAYLDAGLVFVPVAVAVADRFGLPGWVEHAPILLALALVGGAANVSAVRRLHVVAHSASEGRVPTTPFPTATRPDAAPSWRSPS
jgi:CDP-diacylglycerol--glycerol-3-phosphate 3-phosphatidyltransferase